MPVEFIGFITNNNSSETIVRSGHVLNRDHIETAAKVHENAGFDRALLAFSATSPDGLQIGQHVLSVTERLHVMIAQRPGFTAPRYLHDSLPPLISYGGGGFLFMSSPEETPASSGRMAISWTTRTIDTPGPSSFWISLNSNGPANSPSTIAENSIKLRRDFRKSNLIGHQEFRYSSAVASDGAIEAAGKHADTFALWGESYDQVREVTANVRAAAAKYGRPAPRFSLSVRPIVADTEEKAWAKAEAILERATALQDKTGYRKPADGHATSGANRLLSLAEKGRRVDKRLWTEIAKLTGANINTTALVGTPEQVAEVFRDYYQLGVSHFLIRGFDPLIDAIEYGRELIPATRRLIAEHDTQVGQAAE